MEKILLEHLWIVILVVLLTLPFKAAALWRAARRGHIHWFLLLIILNTLGILDILYIFIFSGWGLEKNDESKKQEDAAQQDEFSRQVRQASSSTINRGRPTIV